MEKAKEAKFCHQNTSSKQEFLKCMITGYNEEAVSELSYPPKY